MAGFLHEAPFAFKVFSHVVFCGWEDFLDGYVDAEISSWERGVVRREKKRVVVDEAPL